MKGERQTKAETLLDAMGFVDGDLVLQAHKAEGSRREKRRRWFARGLAACLALVLAAGIPTAMFLHKNSESGDESEASTAGVGTEELQEYLIYYVDGGTLNCVSVRLQAAPQARFDAWKDANHIGDEVEFIGETLREDGYRLTVSKTLSAYLAEGDNLLQQSLCKTMTEDKEASYSGFELYLEGKAVYPDDYPDFVDKYDEQGRLTYSLRPWTDWSIDISEYDYEKGVCTLSHYLAGGPIEPGVTTEPEYTLEYVEEFSINDAGVAYGPYIRHTYLSDGTLDSISAFDEAHIERLYTGYHRDGSVRAHVEYDERGNATKMVYHREDGSFEEHHEVEYDEEGRDCKHIYFDEGGGIEHYELYFFDENGNWAGEEYYNADNVLAFTTKCTYDERGRRLTEAVYRPDGTLEKLTEYKYGSGMFYSSYSVYYYDEEGDLASEWHGGELDGIIAGVTGEE